jgi:hypothetical protein
MTIDELRKNRQELNANLLPGQTPPPLTPQELACLEEENRKDRQRWCSYALSNPDIPVHE